VTTSLQAGLTLYPKNGQGPDQEAIDRRECEQWAAQEAGESAANGSGYQRALVACVQGRGYGVN
jgi:hypothetical protein